MFIAWRIVRFFGVVLAFSLTFWLLPLSWGLGSYPYLALGLGMLSAWAFDSEWHSKRQRLLIARASVPSKVEQHFSVLHRRLQEARRRNDFGAVVRDDTQLVLDDFMQSTGIHPPEKKVAQIERQILVEVDRIAKEHIQNKFDPTTIPSDGFDFEYWVAEAFRKFGWDANPTRATGDQGIDVIVEKSGRKIGIQTKLYSKPVGNKAVQEAYSGQQYHNLDGAAVLANVGFTQSAKSLASSSGIILMSHFDIPNADQLFSLSSREK